LSPSAWCGGSAPTAKTEYQPDLELLEQLSSFAQPATKFYRGQGCVSVQRHRIPRQTGLFEMLKRDQIDPQMVLRNAPAMEIH